MKFSSRFSSMSLCCDFLVGIGEPNNSCICRSAERNTSYDSFGTLQQWTLNFHKFWKNIGWDNSLSGWCMANWRASGAGGSWASGVFSAVFGKTRRILLPGRGTKCFYKWSPILKSYKILRYCICCNWIQSWKSFPHLQNNFCSLFLIYAMQHSW